ncbi:MAG: zinc-dependent metalloprotease [Planctomycetaceae bacterium]|nr:zinc-dependent metalloprotease [Planctomycetaceae bacterium]
MISAKRILFPLLLLATCVVAIPSSPVYAEEEKTSKFDTLTTAKGMKHVSGMWDIYYNEEKMLVHLKSSHLNKDYLFLTSIARGISKGAVLGGMSWGFGDDVLWQFRKVGEKIHVIRRNVRFRADDKTPEAEAVKLAYSDSVLYALPILTTEKGGDLVDMSKIFMSDDQGIGRSLGPGFRFASDRSTWSSVKSFPHNVELQVAAVYSGMGQEFDTVPDARGVQINVHYSISELPNTSYKPREADDRVGYFLTVHKNFSKNAEERHFVRYINRWDLQKEAPKAKLSLPKEPIVFHMEKTIPKHLRPIVRSGILEWNKAFEQIGFDSAIQVIQQGEDETWDPEDVRYNTFRWITAEAGFAMGPSRVNPLTGQILDADIIFDASFLRYWQMRYEIFSAESARELMGRDLPPSLVNRWNQRQESILPKKLAVQMEPLRQYQEALAGHSHDAGHHSCLYCNGMQQQMGFAAAVLMAQEDKDGKDGEKKEELPEEFLEQALKEVVMHEVGHTLGLRHNFKASSWKSLEELNDKEKGAEQGIVASVMDYSPANISPDKEKQGLYYTTTIGPYDTWAIEYGYKAEADEKELKKIASRGHEDGLDYATDEDTTYYNSDPLTNRFDLGKEPMEYVTRQMKLTSELMPKVIDRMSKEGEGYQRVRTAFNMLFSEYWRSSVYAARYIGGVYVHRDHKGDSERSPFKVVDAEKQRQAMQLLMEHVFQSPSYDANVLNHLGPGRWRHWGIADLDRLDFPIHEQVAIMQKQVLMHLFGGLTLSRLYDNEKKVAPEEAIYSLSEHLQLIVDGIFSEWNAGEAEGEYNIRSPYINSYRRNLQRQVLKEFIYLVNRGIESPDSSLSDFMERLLFADDIPEDARTLARGHLQKLDEQITAALTNEKLKLDDYSRAHLQDSQRRIQQVLNSTFAIPSVN